MSDLLDAFRHNTWATEQLLDAVRALDEADLTATAPGAYGSILETLHHCAQSEGFYGYLLADGRPGFTWDLVVAPSPDEIGRRLADLSEFWDGWLAQPVDVDRMVERRNADGTRDEAAVGVLLAQVLHHGNIHREQVSAILTSLGRTPPEIDSWAYGVAVGRVTMDLPATP